jgi:archaellum biogenesis protein FlaJ (TadC family)
MSMKMMMMISILKIVMELMMIQLTTKKKKILTNYQNQGKCKAFFYNVILLMIFCNMKYLFYNC